jgi:hypothetical protein
MYKENEEGDIIEVSVIGDENEKDEEGFSIAGNE